MRVIEPLKLPIRFPTETAVAIGFFDGVHLGHQRILRSAIEKARERKLTSIAITFKDHPLRLFDPPNCPVYLTTLGQKIKVLYSLGIDNVIALPFDWELANQTAEQFCRNCLSQRLRMRSLVCGPDFALGKARKGTVPVLRELGAKLGFTVELVEPLVIEGEPVSSTRIRSLIAEGGVKKVVELLGRPYAIEGEVVTGRGLGRQIGVPTINLRPDPQQALPANGVYAVRACWDDEQHSAVVNIGHRPTVGGGDLTVEFHVMDANIATSPSHVSLEFIERIRDEQKFPSVEALKTQIEEDIRDAKQLLSERKA